MLTGKIFANGRSQAVRLPKECRFEGEEVSVNKIGDLVLLIPKGSEWSCLEKALELFTEDFMPEGRPEQGIQERESL